MMKCLQSWPEPIVRVQSLSDSGISVIPERYVKRMSDRPSSPASEVSIPVIDLRDLCSDDQALRQATRDLISSACRQWGFFQVERQIVFQLCLAATRQRIIRNKHRTKSYYFFINMNMIHDTINDNNF